MITATDPEDGAAGVEPMLVITVTFDEPVAVSEPTDGFQLLDEAGQPVPGTVEVDGNVIRFVPADDLALLGSYTAVVTTAVTDVAGNPLASAHRFRLSVRDGAWDPTGTSIENNDGDARTPDVAMDPRGNVTVVWSQIGSPLSIWANRYDARTGLWATAQMIEHDDAGHAELPRVGMDAAGNAIAVWQQSDGTHTHVWASRHDGTGWDMPVRLDTSDAANAQAPRLAMNASGAAIVVWRHVEETTTEAWINRFDAGSGWGEAEPLQIFGQPASVIGDPVVGIDDQGNGLVLVLDQRFELQAVPYLAAGGWGEAEPLIRGPVDGVDLAMAPTGYAIGLWHLAQPSRIHAWPRNPDGESRIDLLMLAEESEFGQLRTGDVAVNPAGDGIALWIQDSPQPRQVWAGMYSAAAETWSEPQGLFSTDTARPRSVQVGMDPRGHAHAIWIISDGNNYQALVTTRRVAPGGFGPTTTHAGIEHASLAVNAQGKAVIIRAVQTCTGAGTRMDLDAVFFR